MTIIYLIILVIIGAVIFSIVRNNKHTNKSQDVFNHLKDFNTTEVYLSGTSGCSIGYDSERKKICILNTEHQPVIYGYKDILQSELNVDGETILKQSTTGTVGRAILGGLLGGGVGAIIGGVTGSKTQKKKINRIDLKLSLNDSKNPFYKINFMNLQTKKGDILYVASFAQAERWQGIIATLIQQANNLEKDTVNTKDISVADELIKLKSLLDNGILTQTEFENQKKIMLNNSH